MRKLFIISVVLFSYISLKAQNSIEGKVLELSVNGDPLPLFGANVYWEGTNVGTTTDSNGFYIISGPSSLPASLSVSYVGYTFDSKEIIDGQYIFYLNNSVDLGEVDIKGEISTTKISIIEPMNIQTITTGEIQKAACCNLSECFETNNSIDVSYADAVSGIKTIKMLGLAGNYVQITSELIPLTRGLQRSYGLTYIPGSWIESIQIIKGAGSVVNGYESLTGQINVEYFKPEANTERLKVNMYSNSAGKIENNLILSKNSGNWRTNLFTHISYFDREIDVHGYHHDHSDHLMHEGDRFLDMPKFKQFSVLNRWKYYGSDKYNFQINVRGVLEERLAGQITTSSDIQNPYLVNVDNQLIQIYGKIGKIINSNESFGSQISFTSHNLTASFGNNKYDGKQESILVNLIKQHEIGAVNLFKFGSSYSADRYIESFVGNTESLFDLKKRVDLVTGVFLEHQYSYEKINVITGLRGDYYNVEDMVYSSPRINIKYNPSDRTAFRLSAGKSFRISNIFVDNLQYLASSREVILDDDITPEVGWNYGMNFSYCFYLLSREGTLNLDLYRTVFENQLVVNIEDKDKLFFSNLNGVSYSNILQLEFDYNIIDNLNLRMSYKKVDAVTSFDGLEKKLPLQPLDRGLMNLSYESSNDVWLLDCTLNYIGRSRLPENILMIDDFSSPFLLLNSQFTYRFTNFDCYIGAENLTDYTQPNPIIDPENPFGEDFDASLIWGPVMGRTIYLGIRYDFN